MLERRQNGGFTLIELVMVIVVLAILAIVAVPQFFNLADDADSASEQGVIGGVRAGIATFQADALAGGAAAPGYPATLDGVAASTTCDATNPCFTNVLGQGGVTDGSWSTGAAALDYVGPTGTTYTYDPADGTFE